MHPSRPNRRGGVAALLLGSAVLLQAGAWAQPTRADNLADIKQPGC